MEVWDLIRDIPRRMIIQGLIGGFMMAPGRAGYIISYSTGKGLPK